jgi:cytidine deaminase
MALQTLTLPQIHVADTVTETTLGRLRIPGFTIPERMVVIDPSMIQSLCIKARQAADLAYHNYTTNPYRVGAACIMADDPEEHIFTGANCETAILNAGICAERALLHYVVAQGFRTIKYLCVSTPHRMKEDITLRSPCGLCRQAISEFSDDRTLIIIDHQQDGVLADIVDINRLLPYRYQFETV